MGRVLEWRPRRLRWRWRRAGVRRTLLLLERMGRRRRLALEMLLLLAVVVLFDRRHGFQILQKQFN